jgi:UDP-glucose 4-epimerase
MSDSSSLQGQRILITGGAGNVGSHIADLAVQDGAQEIVIVDNFVRGRHENLTWAMANGPVRLVEGDICDRKLIDELTRGIDVVFHQAALRITQCVDEPRLGIDVMVGGTLNVLESVIKHEVRKLVAASSASVYGAAVAFPTNEDHHPYGNDTLYGAAKCFNEGMMRSFTAMYGLNYVALRYFNVYGPRMDIHGVYTEVLVRWMERIEAGLPPIIHGTGDTTMDFIYITDIARANVLAAASEATDEVFNVASGVETSLLELAEALIEVMGANVSVEFGPERAAAKVPRRLAGTELAAERLGFRAEVDLEEGLRRLVEWWRAERAAGAAPAIAAASR